MPRKIGLLVVVLLVALGAVACGSPAPRGRCSSDAGCGAGSYCAAGGVCWPDATPPVLADVTVTCAAPCLRDSTIEVTARASDDGRVAAVTAKLDLAPGQAVPLTLQGGTWRASLTLGSWPFAAFERTVEVTVEAQDGAGNGASASRSAGTVSRLKWEVELAPGAVPVPVPGAVAVDGQGTAILGASDAKVYFINSNGEAQRLAVAVGVGALAAPVVVGTTGVWVPSDDGKVYRVPSDAAAGVVEVCDTGAPVRGVALDASGQPLAASATGAFFSSVGGVCRNSTIYAGDVLQAPVASGSRFFGAEGNNLHAFIFNATGFPVDEWTSPANTVGAPMPLGIRSNGEVVALISPSTGGGSLLSISPAGAPTTLATTGVPSDGPVILAGDEMVVPESGKTLSAWSAMGVFRWRSAALPGTPLTPLVMAGGPDRLVVADAHGNLTALDAAGQVRWTTQLAPAAKSLRPPNLVALPGGEQSLGYFAAANGKLYAVILDGRLDADAPWPKAFHDPRNTGNAATAQPTP